MKHIKQDLSLKASGSDPLGGLGVGQGPKIFFFLQNMVILHSKYFALTHMLEPLGRVKTVVITEEGHFFSKITLGREIKKFLSHWIRISDILPWDRTILILPMLSYPGRQVTSSCEIAS